MFLAPATRGHSPVLLLRRLGISLSLLRRNSSFLLFLCREQCERRAEAILGELPHVRRERRLRSAVVVVVMVAVAAVVLMLIA